MLEMFKGGRHPGVPGDGIGLSLLKSFGQGGGMQHKVRNEVAVVANEPQELAHSSAVGLLSI